MIGRLSWGVYGAFQTFAHPEDDKAVEESQKDPFPEDEDVEVFVLLACFVNLCVRVNYVCEVNVLLEGKGEEACQGGPEWVIKSGQPLGEVDLSRPAVEVDEVDLCEDKNDVLVKVVTNNPGDSAVANSAVNENKLL